MSFKWTQPALRSLTRRTEAGESAASIAAQLGCITRTVQEKQLAIGLRKRRDRRRFSSREIAIVRRDYPTTPTSKIAAQFGCTVSQVYQLAERHGIRKTEEFREAMNAECGRNVAQFSTATQFKKGQTPSNKGLRRPGWGPGRMKDTQFKKGNRTGAANNNWKPVGTIRPDHEGFLRIKVLEPRLGETPTGFGNTSIWPLLHRHTWEQHNGPIPARHNIAFKDGDRNNCDISNLECISRVEQMRRNTIHNRYPKEIAHTITLLGAVKRRIRENAKKHND